jgi:protein-S-isoprenylcysteine O-methyltransferase Ste14
MMPLYLLLFRVLLAAVLYAALLMGIPWEWDWLLGWVFTALTLGIGTVEMVLLNIKNPELIRERVKPGGEAKPFDKILSKVVVYFGFIYLVLAGLDRRFGWSPQLPLIVQVVACFFYSAFLSLSYWAMHVNRYFSSVVRIQADRGQTVCKDGPYRFIRHPGYSGAILSYLVMPLILSTLWVFIPVVIASGLFVLRIILEEKALIEELPGYTEYTKETRYRLIPGIW